jgi:hypothetical protein
MKKTSKSKSKKYPKLKKYALGLNPNDPSMPVTATNNPVGNIDPMDPRFKKNYQLTQKVSLGDQSEYYKGNVNLTPEEFAKINRSGDIRSMTGVMPITEQDWRKNIGTGNQMIDYQRHKYGGVQLPKYEGGLTPMTVPEDPSLRPYSAPAESAAVTQQKQQQAQLDANAKKEKNAANAATGVQIGSGIVSGAAQAYQTSQTPGLSTYDRNQQYSKAIENTEQSVVGSIAPGYGLIHQGVSAIMDPLTAEATKTDAEGNLVNRNNAEAESIGRAFADPMAMIPHMISTGFSTDKYADQIEESAKAKIAAQKAQEDAYAQQKASQQAEQKAYMNQQIQSGIDNYYSNPDKNKNQSQTFAMGGVPQMPNAEVEGNEMITSNTRPQTFGGGGVELASNNPYGTPTYKTNGASHANGGMPISMAPGSVINGKTINPMTGNKFTKDIDAIAKMENKFTKKAESGDKYSRTMAKLMLPTLAMKKEKLNELQKYVIANNEERKALKNGVIPSRDNEMSEPQGMHDQTEGEMVMAKYGAQIEDPYKKAAIINEANKARDMKEINAQRNMGSFFYPNSKNYFNETYSKDSSNVEDKYKKFNNLPKNRMGGIQGLPMYKNGLTPMQVPEDPEIRTQQDWYFPKPKNEVPGFADPRYSASPFMQDQNMPPDEMPYKQYSPQPEYNNWKPGMTNPNPSPFVSPKESDRLQYENDVRKANEQGMAAKKAGKKQRPDPKNYSNYADYAAAAAQLAGPITALIQNKKPALQNYVAPQASLLNSTEAMRQANIEANAARKGLKDMTSGNVGQQLGNLGSVAARNALAKAQVQERYDNANAQIMNRNAEIAAGYAKDSINKRDEDLARYEDINTKSIGDIGTSLANINKDSKQTQYDLDYLYFIKRQNPQAYQDYLQYVKDGKKDKSNNNKADV